MIEFNALPAHLLNNAVHSKLSDPTSTARPPSQKGTLGHSLWTAAGPLQVSTCRATFNINTGWRPRQQSWAKVSIYLQVFKSSYHLKR